MGKEEISTVCMFFSKSFYFSIVFAALYLSSKSVSGRTGGGRRLLSKMGTGVERGREGLKTSEDGRTSFMDDH